MAKRTSRKAAGSVGAGVQKKRTTKKRTGGAVPKSSGSIKKKAVGAVTDPVPACARAAKPSLEPPVVYDHPGDGQVRGTCGHRLRQASVSVILDQVFGPLGECDPELWDRRAYLLLVGSAYERMSGDDEISTDELVKLARVLAENRRSKAGMIASDSSHENDNDSVPKNGQLPNRFAEMVRNLYGTTVAVGDGRSSAST